MLAGHVEEMDHSLEVTGDLTRQIDEPMGAIRLRRGTRHREPRSPVTWNGPNGSPGRRSRFATDNGPHRLRASTSACRSWAVSVQRGTAGELLPFLSRANLGLPSRHKQTERCVPWPCVEGDRFDVAAQLLEEFATAGFELHMDSQWLTSMLCYAEVAIDREGCRPCRRSCSNCSHRGASNGVFRDHG